VLFQNTATQLDQLFKITTEFATFTQQDDFIGGIANCKINTELIYPGSKALKLASL
jgi:hypothetical protein